jgi:hypothetical protein
MIGRKRVAMSSIDQHRSSPIGEVLDPTFGNAVLVVGVDAAKSHSLVCVFNRGAELLGGKNTIVAMVVVDGYVVLFGEALEGLFCQ